MEKVIRLREVKNSRISVVIPTLNEEKYLEKTLLSIKAQNFEYPYEIIVSDSNSKDKTVEIARKYVNKVIITDKRGIGLGRNLGAKYARGEVLVFLDADTIVLPNTLNELYRGLKPETSLVTCPVLPSNYRTWNFFVYLFYNLFSQTSIMIKRPQVAGMVMACRKKDFEKVGGFDENLNFLEDYDFSLKISRLGKVKFVNSTFVLTSPRRIETWGKIGSIRKYLGLYLAYHLVKKDLAKYYKPVR